MVTLPLDGDSIEAEGAFVGMVEEIGFGRLKKPLPLPWGDPFETRSEAEGMAELHLDEDQRLSLPEDQIDLPKAAAVVLTDRFQALGFEIAEGDRLSLLTLQTVW